MDSLNELIAPLAAYPRWFVLSCLVLVAAIVIWLVFKALKWLLYTVLVGVLLVGGTLAVLLFFK